MGDGMFGPDVDVSENDSKADKENANTSTTALQLPSLQVLQCANPTAHGKLRAVIELKSLRLLDKQRTLRASISERLTHGTMLPLNRLDMRRVRKPTIRDARMTERLERNCASNGSSANDGLNTNMSSNSL